jgi:thiol-disulfide isomerase/thioredoxin
MRKTLRMGWWVLLLTLPLSLSAKNAPSFKNAPLFSGGKNVSLEELLKPDRVLLLSFWATWCLPCLSELTEVTKKLKENPGLPIDLVTVNTDREDRSEIPATLRTYGFNFPVILDPTGDIFGKYQKVPTLPFSVLILPNKTIEAEFNGYHESMFEKIQAAVAKLKKPEKS